MMWTIASEQKPRLVSIKHYLQATWYVCVCVCICIGADMVRQKRAYARTYLQQVQKQSERARERKK